MRIKYFILILFFTTIRILSYSQQAGGDLFDMSVIHEVRINFTEDNFWDILIQNFEGTMWGVQLQGIKPSRTTKEFYQSLQSFVATSDEDEVPLLDASIIIDGVPLNPVGVRLKGYSSYFSSPYYKKSIKVDLNANNDTLDYYGLKKINLHNGVGDPSLQRDVICYSLMRKAGIAAPRTSYVKLYLNDVYWGIFVNVEQVDKTFLENNFASGEGNLFKAVGWSNLEYSSDDFAAYYESIGLKTNEETSDGSDYVKLVKSISELNGNSFNDSIQKLFYVDYYFKVMSIDIITKNWDSFIQHGRNFYLYHEPVSDLFYWIPWDYNLALDGQFSWGEDNTKCESDLDFSFDTVGNTVKFHLDTTGYHIMSMWWNFGDNTWQETDTSLTNPIHKYEPRGIFPVNIDIYLYNGCYINLNKHIALIDTAGICPTALKMNAAYYPSAEFNMVFDKDDYCCNCGWDNICNVLYSGIYQNSEVDDQTYPIEYLYGGKPLIDKLLANNELKKRYFDIFKFVLDSVFVENQIFEMIQNNAALIRDAVYADTNYIFTTGQFEYDITSICEKPEQITNLQRFISKRKAGLVKEYESLNHTPEPLERIVHPQDVVINEIAANTIDDEGKAQSDWIELYNNTNTIISLKYFGLSDDFDAPDSFLFPSNAAIKPDGYIIIWADKEDRKNNLHANFKLSAGGEQVIMMHRKFGTIDSVEFGVQYTNRSYARFPNGTGPFIEMTPTFNSKNVKLSDINNPELEFTNTAFFLYPNPASDFLTIQANSPATDFSIEMYNSLGQMLVSKKSLDDKLQIDVRNFPNGLYFIEIELNGNHESIKTIIGH
jgi:hypothetical protein